MEDGLGLSLSLKAFEKSPPPLKNPNFDRGSSYERLDSNKNNFFNKVGYSFKSTPKVIGSKTQEEEAYTKLNLGPISVDSKPRHDDRGAKVSTPKLSSVAGKRSGEREGMVSSEGGGGEKKKLRLSKEQSTLLEQTFLEHSTLNNKQKLYLAKQLNLKPRQVEVWFQNRRARTKLKQTEVDCEFLKKYCEKLCDENKRLQKELQELTKLGLHSNTPTLCHTCNRAEASGSRHSVAAAFSRPLQPNVSALFSTKCLLAQDIDLRVASFQKL